ncbi:MAG: DUF1937 family protein [Myxococcales bacterium FL481]|nr:MAG: DUF1937 family protein [Myxococcales bacterium FL481]
MQPLPLVYVAGPYRASTLLGVRRNIQRAMELGANVARWGAMPVIPHSNTPVEFTDIKDADFWLDGTLNLMLACDAVVLVEYWQSSSGAKNEIAVAKKNDMPVFEKWLDLVKWIDAWRP